MIPVGLAKADHLDLVSILAKQDFCVIIKCLSCRVTSKYMTLGTETTGGKWPVPRLVMHIQRFQVEVDIGAVLTHAWPVSVSISTGST